MFINLCSKELHSNDLASQPVQVIIIKYTIIFSCRTGVTNQFKIP